MFKPVLSLLLIMLILIGCEKMPKNNETTSVIQNHKFNMTSIDATTAGILESSPSTFTLDTTYSQPNQYAIYYGQLQYSGITDYSVYDFMIVSDTNVESVTKVREQGVKVFQYIHFGSRFEDSDQYVQTLQDSIKLLKDQGIADGIFLDECDIAYWDATYQEDTIKQQIFHSRLQEITLYIKSLGMESVVNGTRSFAELGDYYLWESYVGYWNSNQLIWDSMTSLDRTLSLNGEVTYGRRFADWNFEGTTSVENGKVVGGQKGAMEIVLDMDKILRSEDIRDQYDWIYPQWKGSGGSNDTVTVKAWIGDNLPFDTNIWTQVPDLWTGEADSWIGIGKRSKYLKLRFEFNGANELSMEQMLLKFNYNFPYWDMNSPNGAADTNTYMWNFNNSQLDYIQQKNFSSNSSIKTLSHSYGELVDQERINYTFLSNAVHELYGWSYADPLMQKVQYYDISNEPIGMLLRQEKSGNITTGYFTGSTVIIDSSSHTAKLDIAYPDYYYKEAITIDGNMTDWSKSDQLYTNFGSGYTASSYYWGATKSTFAEGSFDNVKVITRNGQTSLELIDDGTGSWISGIQGEDSFHSRKNMTNLSWQGSENGKVNYYIQFQNEDGIWSDWLLQSPGTTQPNEDFYSFRVKVVLDGQKYYEPIASAAEEILQSSAVSFSASSHEWKTYIAEDAHVTNVSMTDDRQYLYIKLKTAGQINLKTDENDVPYYFYNIYIDSNDVITEGFKGSWWNSPEIAATHRITNEGLYEWDSKFTDQHSNEGWIWVNEHSVDNKISASGDEIEYRITKSNLGDLSSENVNFYVTADEVETMHGQFIQPDFLNGTEFTGQLSYTQKVFHPYVPHGYIQSEVIEAVKGNQVTLTWTETILQHTDVKAWTRTRSLGSDSWNNWTESNNGQVIEGSFDRIQYSMGLYTKQGKNSPQVSDIVLSYEETKID
ncbi:hypothetical protein [Paenibacillus endoradicis]|uniref:hypothetical protein n=1 Tax=Paenibacillus endoradicis TaxID=2972487 RepID=UPI002159782A|nr:hypothetical protein [Paenibacillus endoradicis]MCR8656989.1 hypothetical protein [Paenibacillus endoradicis]